MPETTNIIHITDPPNGRDEVQVWRCGETLVRLSAAPEGRLRVAVADSAIGADLRREEASELVALVTRWLATGTFRRDRPGGDTDARH